MNKKEEFSIKIVLTQLQFQWSRMHVGVGLYSSNLQIIIIIIALLVKQLHYTYHYDRNKTLYANSSHSVAWKTECKLCNILTSHNKMLCLINHVFSPPKYYKFLPYPILEITISTKALNVKIENSETRNNKRTQNPV